MYYGSLDQLIYQTEQRYQSMGDTNDMFIVLQPETNKQSNKKGDPKTVNNKEISGISYKQLIV